MDTWSLPKALPISCNDCPAFQRHHISVRWFTESFTRLRCAINTTFREKIYTRWCCIDRLSWHLFSESGFLYLKWWFMLQRYAAKESLRNFWRALLSLPRMNFPVGRLLGHRQNGERTRQHRAASNASV